MASPPKKPRDIKNLKARLGRTITPGQAGLGSKPPGVAPSGSFPPAAGSVPPPTLGGGGLPTPAIGSVPAPGGAVPGGIQPPKRGPAAPPPAASSTPPAASGRPAAGGSPFGQPGAVVAQQKQVTLVIDDSAVKESEIGRGSRTKTLVLVAVGAVLGLIIGFGVGDTRADRALFSMAVADGKAIYNKIGEVSKAVEGAKVHLKAAVAASQGGPGKKAHADYKAITELVKLEKPFSANEFHRRRYRAFPVNVVDDLFDYYNNVNILWAKFEGLGTMTTGEKRQKEIDKSAEAADGLLEHQFGLVLMKANERFTGGLVYLRMPQQGELEEPPEEGDAPIMMVSTAPGRAEIQRKLYMGQTDLAENNNNYVFLLDKARSMRIIGEQASLFGKVRGELMIAQALMGKLGEAQGRLLQELGKVAALE